MSEFSERLITLIKKKGLSQKEFAAKSEVTESAMSYYVKGQRTPSGDVLARIARALNTSTDFLLGANDSENVEKPELKYLQRNLSKLDEKQLKKAEGLLKIAFDDIFNDDEDEE